MQESGCRLDHPAAAKFCQHVMDGDWNKVNYGFEVIYQSLLINDFMYSFLIRLKWI